jgi:deazaflavin-dependent oxidoreductase (nitroreductase family)
VAADDYCYLTTTGRRTGRAHRVEIWYAADGDRTYMLSGGGRTSDWVQNLIADSNVVVEIEGQTREARARVIDAADTADRRARTLVFEKYAPRYEGDLTGWRERSLPIVIEPA